MRLVIVATVLTCIFASAGTLARDYEDVPPDYIFDTPERRYNHLEYVGFFGSAMQHWNFTEELAGITNITWVTNANMDIAIQRVREAQETGVEVVISVQPYVFDSNYELRPDYLDALVQLQQKLEMEDLTRTIAMVYPVDEPLLHAGSSSTTDRKRMYRDIDTVNDDLRELFPAIPIGVIFNNKEVMRNSFIVPESYDWVGFDCYENMFDCKKKAFTRYYRTLLERMTDEQQLIAVPQALVKDGDYEKKFYETPEAYQQRLHTMVKGLKKRLRHHYEVALSEPRFVAFIPFIWSLEAAPGRAENSGFGADQFTTKFPKGGEAFVNYLEQITQEIKTDDYQYPNISRRQTEASLYRPPNRYKGKIMDVSDDGLISAWGANWALPHKSLRMQVIVQRQGEEIYTSDIERSFILDRSLAPPATPDLPAIGVHGYRYTLPESLLRSLRGKSAVIRLRMYGDGATLENYREVKKKVFF